MQKLLAPIFFLLLSCNSAPAPAIHDTASSQIPDTSSPSQPPSPQPSINLTGSWGWCSSDTTEAMWLDLLQSGDSLSGAYCAFQRAGMRYDCGETGEPVCPVWGKLSGNTAELFFTSCYSGSTAKAELTYDTIKGTLLWEVKPAAIQHYAQLKAELTRNK